MLAVTPSITNTGFAGPPAVALMLTPVLPSQSVAAGAERKSNVSPLVSSEPINQSHPELTLGRTNVLFEPLSWSVAAQT